MNVNVKIIREVEVDNRHKDPRFIRSMEAEITALRTELRRLIAVLKAKEGP